MSEVLTDFADTGKKWRTWFIMANQDIELRYRRSFIGPFWLSISMLMLILGIGFLYSTIFKQDFVEFLTFFASGILAWNLISALLLEGCSSVLYAESNLRNVPISIPVLAARTVYSNLIIFGHNALAVAAMLLVFRHPFTMAVFLAIPAVVVYLLAGYFWAIVMGPLCARFRDIAQVVASILQVAFFMTPILWRPEFAESRPMVTEINPFYHLIEIFRAPILGSMPTAMNWLVSLGIVAVLGLLAVVVDSYARRRVFIWL